LNGIQQHQHNFLDDITGDTSFLDEEDFEGGPFSTSPSPLNSPDRKRHKIADGDYTDKEEATEIPLTFEEFDSLPIAARNQSKWNGLLLAYPEFWLKKCQSWSSTLDQAYAQCMVSFSCYANGSWLLKFVLKSYLLY